jgi:hypothetical protein
MRTLMKSLEQPVMLVTGATNGLGKQLAPVLDGWQARWLGSSGRQRGSAVSVKPVRRCIGLPGSQQEEVVNDALMRHETCPERRRR